MSTTKTAPVQVKKNSKEIYSEIVEITPEYAEKLLKRNPINRPINHRSVKHYAQQMLKGDWCSTTDESIKLSDNDIILDGQHRLSAIVKAAIPVKMKITYNLPEEIFRYIDQGKKRTAGDVLYIADVPNAKLISGMIKRAIVLMNENNTALEASATQLQLSNEDIYEAYLEKPQYWQDVCNKSMRWWKAFHKIIAPSILAGHFHIFAQKNITDAETFMEKLCTGIGVTNAGDPVRVLRDYFLRQLDLKGRKANTASYNSAIMIKAWNYYREKKEISILKWDSSREQYPKAI